MLNLLLFVFLQLSKNDIQEESALESHHLGGFRVSHNNMSMSKPAIQAMKLSVRSVLKIVWWDET